MRSRIFAAGAYAGLCVVAAVSAVPTRAATACDRQLVMQIDSGRVSVEPDGISVDAFGTSESAGWSKPTLIVTQRSGDTATVDFVACRPEVSAQVLTPIQTNAMLDLPPDTAKIIIRARTNSMTVEISGH
ncbi:MAG: hypothetical protein ABL973_17310 [Micropepsaceae bacterium]